MNKLYKECKKATPTSKRKSIIGNKNIEKPMPKPEISKIISSETTKKNKNSAAWSKTKTVNTMN